MARRWWLGIAAACLAAAPARAQRLPDARPRVVSAAAFRGAGAAVPDSGAAAGGLAALARRPWLQPVASLIVPGTGQLLGGKDRGLLYLAAEVWIATRAIALTDEGHRSRSAYQQLAFAVARAPFTGDPRLGSWDYYESMTHFVESGSYNSGAPGTLMPEQDTLTFNGATWLLARRTFFVNPDSTPDPASAPYQAALAFYQQHAVQPAFQWSWRNARLEQDVYESEIRNSDDAFRSATNYLGALVLNHITSAIDALISIRLTGGVRVPEIPRLYPGMQPGEVAVVWNWDF